MSRIELNMLSRIWGPLDIELLVYLPVTVKTSSRQIVYEIEANLRDSARTEQLRHACEELNRRQIHKGKRLLRFAVIDPSSPGSG